MKILILTSCLLALASAGYEYFPLHIPVIGPHGVPLEPSEVVHARQAHLSHYNAIKSQQGHNGYYAPDSSHHGEYHGAYHGPLHYPVIGHNGVPLETPEVAHARAAHFAAHANARAKAYQSGYSGHDGHYRKRRGINGPYGYSNYVGAYHVPMIGHNGVPLDTPEVSAAKAEHFAAHSKASHGAPYVSSGYHNGYAHQYPALAHNGQPLETPEVSALKHAHFAAHAEAKSRNVAYGGHHDDGQYRPEYHHGNAYTAQSYHIPVITPHGVPVETPEVAAAKQKHFAAHAAAQSHGYSKY